MAVLGVQRAGLTETLLVILRSAGVGDGEFETGIAGFTWAMTVYAELLAGI